MASNSTAEHHIANAFITTYEHPKFEFELESHYNYYGNRGRVDLVVKSGRTLTLMEFKSENAIQRATGPQDIIGQFNKMRQFFLQKNPRYSPARLSHIRNELSFYATNTVASHVFDNLALYRAAQQLDPTPVPRKRLSPHSKLPLTLTSAVNFRHPASVGNPVPVFNKDFSCLSLTPSEYADFVREKNPSFYEHIADALARAEWVPTDATRFI
ncbi:hypothetical protein [Haladaptatus sp. DYSN1]|uniref:hypothetical protein n=1 Tax=unclassified Haladaptatus TaxID=2622732 RepID=UPI002405B3BA|nr:hypothetical protein [Haladaptatus sp. DYSN1]